MARRFAVPRGGRPAPRSMIWIGSHLGETATAATIKTLMASLSVAVLALRPFTVVRTRLDILIRSDQAAVSEQVRGAFGMIVVSDQAVAAGAASIPGPASETNGDWFVYEPWNNRFEFLSSVGFAQPSGTNLVVDSKAMRKVGDN